MLVDLKNIPPDWSLYDAAVSYILVSGIVNLNGVLVVDEVSTRRVICGVSRAWYEDERSGFNAEHIELGGEGG